MATHMNSGYVPTVLRSGGKDRPVAPAASSSRARPSYDEGPQLAGESRECTILTSDSSNSSAMKSKLAILSDRINGFEKQMESEARQRRESEEGRISAIRDAIAKLEKTLNAEIKRRVEASKALQSLFESQISNVQEKLETAFLQKIDHMQKAADSLNERMDHAEKDFNAEQEKFQVAAEEKQGMLAKDLSILQGSLESEKINRQDRETQLIKRFGDLETQLDNRFEAEKNAREQKYEKILEELEETKMQRETGDESFQTFLLEEIASIKNGLVLESQARENADDDIVSAVNHYTKALQDALRLVSTS
ncbi:SF-assemblin/beta giardin protein [Cardiosporidium cionae]|uniref:SF-assemblin/beta giardin protein n=1 Tax=Cardiosporidium cionae TaxID=476202 RepID=A0ABQ7JGF2_9APIC|nr:SF-assemblin/beta giardin protein [Cardiosporidium cionae]|eukprot:KAF8823115.1 SF-assemblin/beta giardin protein [Cardiosporidium cionae]